MKRSKRLFSVIFKRIVFSIVLVYFIVFLVFMLSYNYYYDRYVIPGEIESVSNSINNIVSLGFNNLIESSEENEMLAKEILYKLSDEYIEKGKNEVEKVIREIKRDEDINGIDYYIIRNGIITETSYATDLGFDFKKIEPDFWIFLIKQLQREETFISNISFESQTNIPRIYGYRKIDENTIFEIGLILNDTSIETFIGYFQNLLIKRRVEEVEVYNVMFVPFNKKSDQLSEEEKEIFREIEGTKGEKPGDISGEKIKLYVKWQSNTEKLQATFYSKILLNFNEFSTIRNYLILIFILFCLITCFVILSVNFFNLKKYLNPLSKKIKDIDLEGENFHKTGIYEFDILEHVHLRELEEEKDIKETLRKEKNIYQELAKKDHLTGLINLLGCREILNNILKKSYESTVIYMDLDNLKETNDKYGHSAGDEIIKEFSKILLIEIRETDYASRIGGDEFLILLPNTNLKAAKNILKRINDNIFKRNKEEKIKIRFSHGFESTKNIKNLDNLIKTADEKMYKNKKSKRY